MNTSVAMARCLFRSFTFGISYLMAGCAALSPPLTGAEVAGYTARLSAELETSSIGLPTVIDAGSAAARAIAFNYEVRAKALEAALANAKVRVESGAMLPDIVAESDYFRRDRPQFSHSNQSQIYSTSSDIQTLTMSIELSWNILDFGLSFLRATQAVDKAHKQIEDVRRIAARVNEETRTIFWRAVALHALVPQLGKLDIEIEDALARSRRAIGDPMLDPMDQINLQRNTLEQRREINQIYSQIAGADFQLRHLMALSSSEKLTLDPRHDAGKLQLPNLLFDDDLAIALQQRPEIRQHMYDMRISALEVKALVLRILPGATLTETFTSDSNSFLLNSNWVSWGSRIAANLIEILRLPAKLEDVRTQQAIDRQNTLVTAAAIAMQLHVARARVAIQLRGYRDAEHLAQTQRQLLRQVQNTVKVGKASEQVLAQEKAAVLLAGTREILAFGDLQAALASYEAARGDVMFTVLADVGG